MWAVIAIAAWMGVSVYQEWGPQHQAPHDAWINTPASPPPLDPSPGPPAVTCPQVAPGVRSAVSVLRADDAHYQEAWITGGHRDVLDDLIEVTNSAEPNSNSVNDDAFQFNSDAMAYENVNNGSLAPAWQVSYSQVSRDINAMAADCDLHTAPPVSM